MKTLKDYEKKNIRLLLISGREVEGLLGKCDEDEVVIHNFGQQNHIRRDYIEGFVVS